MSRQPKDDNNNPIPILPLKAGGGQSVAIGEASARSTAVTTQAVTLHATTNCFIEIGDATVVASNTTSHYLPELQTYDVSTSILFGTADTKNIAVIRDTADGVLFISERN
tara:strand:+ start:361 stop:690 length:330 start_codon:yes stop_codon:yes gene_type:complete